MITRVYSDGACIGNPGPGGWAAVVLVDGDAAPSWLTGAEPLTTNNKMELLSALRGIEEARRLGAEQIVVYSDSQYLVRGMTEWIDGWKRNGWLTASKQPVKNRDLWMRLDAVIRAGRSGAEIGGNGLSGGMKVAWTYVRGHAGNHYNEECDRRANDMAWAVSRR